MIRIASQRRFRSVVLTLLALALPMTAWTQGLPGLTSSPGPGGSQTWSLSVQTLVLLTSLTFLPVRRGGLHHVAMLARDAIPNR